MEHVIPVHGAADLPEVHVDAYNAELRNPEGFIGDRASRRAFESILDDWREHLRAVGEDPLGKAPTNRVGKRKLDKLLLQGNLEVKGLILSAIEDFAQELTTVCRRLLRLKAWQDTQRIVIGGGFSASWLSELAVARAGALLKSAGLPVELQMLRHDPDEAGLIGAAHLVPRWMLTGHDAMIGVDIGGTNIRAGVVSLPSGKHANLAEAEVLKSEIWRHADEKPTRDEAVERLADMLRGLIEFAGKRGKVLAPLIGIGCPGLIRPDGTIERGGQNLPGNWESRRFNLPRQLREMLPRIEDHEPALLMHNDAVVQGLSQVPWMQDVERWAILTIGTGLGNARFTNRTAQ